MQQFRANGKLLLSGEYVILDGAKGLALPTKLGQTLSVEDATGPGISWTALDNKGREWFRCALSPGLEIENTTDAAMAETLVRILGAARENSVNPVSGISAITRLEFPGDWGLGSSSTLISLVSQYTGCDPYALLAQTFGGSGYDIACATATQPLIYERNSSGRFIQPVHFAPPFMDDLYFLHLGRKQDSRAGMRHYRQTVPDPEELAGQISGITEKLLHAFDFDEFCYYLDLHEMLIAGALQHVPVKASRFPDFPGSLKSLGAWGGDFICVACDEDETLIRRYFIDKGYPVLLKYSELILS